MSLDPFEQDEPVTVHVLPAKIDIIIAPSQPIMRAAQAQGIRWPNACNGQAQCGLCVIEVLQGDLAMTQPSLRESQMLARIPHKPRLGGIMRLACQLSPTAGLVVHKMGVRLP